MISRRTLEGLQMTFRMNAKIATFLGALLVGGVLTTSPAQASITLCADGGACAVGDIGPGGGVVFYAKSADDQTSSYSMTVNSMGMPPQTYETSVTLTAATQEALPFDYLEAAPQSDVVSRPWASNDSGAGTGDSAFGTGSANTDLIMSMFLSDTEANNASYYAHSYTSHGTTGWFMPSIDELVVLINAHFNNVLGAGDPVPSGQFYVESSRLGSSYYSMPNQQLYKDFGGNVHDSHVVIPVRGFSQTVFDQEAASGGTVQKDYKSAVKSSTTVTFVRSKSVLSSASKKLLAAAVAKVGKSGTFVIIGSAGPLPGVTAKQMTKLEEQRAKVIKAYLVTLGVKASSVTTKVIHAKANTQPKTSVTGTAKR